MTCSFAALRRPLSIAVFAVASALGVWSPLTAQSAQLVQPIPDSNDPVERLGRYIRILAGSPRDLDALLGAGQAALDVGDANAALGFFARAEEVAPSSGRVKAGLGSSLVMIERPDDALRLFAEAVSAGMAESGVARDRGLAYDLRGDPKRAQRDYALAMTRGRDDELVRRYALSLGISGDRTGAMAMLDPLLRRQDQGAWRARAFIMAMNGDVAGANGVARQLMVPAMASAMSPLLSRLSSLNAAERGHAVNFGTVPTDGTQLAVQTGDPFLTTVPRRLPKASTVVADSRSRMPETSGDRGLIPTGEPLGPRPIDVTQTRIATVDSLEPRRRPGQDNVLVATGVRTPSSVPLVANAPARNPNLVRLDQRISTRIGPVDPARLPAEARGEGFGIAQVQTGSLPAPDGLRPLGTSLTSPSGTPSPPVAAVAMPTRPLVAQTSVAPPLVKPQYETTAPSVPRPSATVPASRLAGLLTGIEREQESVVELPNTKELRSARAAARKKMAQLAAQTAAEEAAKREKVEQAAAAKRNPARVWVQIATGRNDSGLGITLRHIRSDNEAALKGLSGWSTPYKATNRILVGPMKSAASARELVSKLARNGVTALTYSSDAGDEVDKIPVK